MRSSSCSTAPRPPRRPRTGSSPSSTTAARSSASGSRRASRRRSSNDPVKLTFAIDGAIAKARTGAFFANNTAPLTSRTVQALSESTVLQREVESNPNITDPNSPLRGPGTVAPIGVGGHFPRERELHPAGRPGPDRAHQPRHDVQPRPRPDQGHGRRRPAAEPLQRPGPVHPAPAPARDQVPARSRSSTRSRRTATASSRASCPGRSPGASRPCRAACRSSGPSRRRSRPARGCRRSSSAASASSSRATPATPTPRTRILNGLAFDPTKPDRSQEAEAVAIAALGGIIDVTTARPERAR